MRVALEVCMWISPVTTACCMHQLICMQVHHKRQQVDTSNQTLPSATPWLNQDLTKPACELVKGPKHCSETRRCQAAAHVASYGHTYGPYMLAVQQSERRWVPHTKQLSECRGFAINLPYCTGGQPCSAVWCAFLARSRWFLTN